MNAKATQSQDTERGSGVLTAEERAAMKERAAEAKAEKSRRGKPPVDTEPEVLEKIAEMPDGDRAIAERIHAIVREVAPSLVPRTWYGMPAYARDGKVVCFVQPASKFKARYATLGFNDDARLDDGAMWPTAYAITQLGEAEEALVRELVARAAG